jgi:hypothetical protein
VSSFALVVVGLCFRAALASAGKAAAHHHTLRDVGDQAWAEFDPSTERTQARTNAGHRKHR